MGPKVFLRWLVVSSAQDQVGASLSASALRTAGNPDTAGTGPRPLAVGKAGEADSLAMAL